MELTPTSCPNYPPTPLDTDDVLVMCASPSTAYDLRMALAMRGVPTRLDGVDPSGLWVAAYLAQWVRNGLRTSEERNQRP